LVIDQQYQRDVSNGEAQGNAILEQNKYPESRLKKLSFDTATDENTQLFLAMDIGDLVEVVSTNLEIDAWYYIQGIEFEISENGYITFYWTLVQCKSVESGYLSPIVLEFTDPTSSINFGRVPQLTNPEAVSIVSSIFLDSTEGMHIGIVSTCGGDYSGFTFYVNSFGGFRYLRIRYFFSGTGITCDYTTELPEDEYIRVGASINRKTRTAQLYVNGSPVATTLSVGANSTYNDDAGNDLYIAHNAPESTVEGGNSSLNGKLKDTYIYTRVLTDAEFSADNTTHGTIKENLVWSGPYVRTSELASYEDKTLTSSDKLIDSTGWTIGTPENSPISRLP